MVLARFCSLARSHLPSLGQCQPLQPPDTATSTHFELLICAATPHLHRIALLNLQTHITSYVLSITQSPCVLSVPRANSSIKCKAHFVAVSPSGGAGYPTNASCTHQCFTLRPSMAILGYCFRGREHSAITVALDKTHHLLSSLGLRTAAAFMLQKPYRPSLDTPDLALLLSSDRNSRHRDSSIGLPSGGAFRTPASTAVRVPC
jgi:hypothetical protein